jgi:hypothetical protein
LFFLLCCGCQGNALGLVNVDGTVKCADGTVPAGEVRTIRFEPIEGSTSARAATAEIQPDGSFQMMTLKPGDGVVPGEYAVTLVIWKTYRGQEPVLPAAYSRAATSPLPKAVVKSNGSNHFNFLIESSKGRQ